jgi:SAM-dependent methyltransferase
MLNVVYAESADNLLHLLRFYAPDCSLVLDVTSGGGTLSRRLDGRVVRCDIDATAQADVRADAGALPFAGALFDALVFDPPYLYGSDAMHQGPVGLKTWATQRSTWREPAQLIDLSRRVAAEAFRVLRPYGVAVVKVMDSRLNGRIVRNHDLAREAFEDAGFLLGDDVIYIRTVTGSFTNPKSAQNAHGHFLVMRRAETTRQLFASEGLMIEDVVDWREQLAKALGKPERMCDD